MFLKKISRGVVKPCNFQHMLHRHAADGKRERSEIKFANSRSSRIWKNCPHWIHIADEKAADNVAKIVTEDLRSDSIILEANPGPGILTKALLDHGAPRLRLFVPEKSDYISELKEIESRHSSLEICYLNILEISKIVAIDAEKGTSVLPRLFENIEIKRWDEPPAIKLVAPLSPVSSFLRHLFNHVAHSTGVFTCGRVELFPFITDNEYMKMTAGPKAGTLKLYNNISVLYRSFYDIQYLTQFSWDIFEPKITEIHPSKNFKGDPFICHLVKLTVRQDLHSKIGASNLPLYLYFITQAMKKPTNHVIAFFEKLMPGCGPKILKLGIPLFTQFGDLEPNSFIDLFCEISKWDEFEPSHFSYLGHHKEYEDFSRRTELT